MDKQAVLKKGMIVFGVLAMWQAFTLYERKAQLIGAQKRAAAFHAPEDSIIGRLRLAREKAEQPEEIHAMMNAVIERIIRRISAAEKGLANESAAVTLSDAERALCAVEERLRRAKKCSLTPSVRRLLAHAWQAFAHFKKKTAVPSVRI